ncbi:MAG TPA: hypothetical protein DCR44_04475 [Acholeplasmatales bacterium]|nr:hypothetical protein [Acholeplasmatales bacterium]
MMIDGLEMNTSLATWWWGFSRLFYVVAIVGLFAVVFGARIIAKRKGYGWVSFLPVMIPAVPTAIIVYGIIRYEIRNGPCLPEDGCMDEASGPAFLGFIATVVVFAICLAFELTYTYARNQKARPSLPLENRIGNSPTGPKPTGFFGKTVLPVLGLLFIGGVAAYLAMMGANILFSVLNAITVALFRFEYSEWMVRMILIGPFALAYVYIERSKMSTLAKAVILTAMLEVVLFSGWAVFRNAPMAIVGVAVATIAVTTVLLVLFKKPWLYHCASIVAVAVALIYMLS